MPSTTAPRVSTTTIEAFMAELFARFAPAFAAAPHTVERNIAGTLLSCRSHDAGYLEQVRRALAHDPHADAGAHLDILVAHGGRDGMPLPPEWGEPYFVERAFEAGLSPTRYRAHYFLDKRFWQFFDLDTGRGIQLMAGAGAYPDWDPGSPLRNFVHWHAIAQGRRLVHAGTLARNGRGILLAGSGGSGKSGTVIAGLLAGLESAGDDYVLVEAGEAVTAFPVFRTMKQDPAGFDRLGLHRLFPAPEINWQGKHQFLIEDIDRERVCGPIDVRALCLPVVTGAERTHVRPVANKEAFLALAPSGVSQMPGGRDEHFAFCAALVHRLPCKKVELGTDPVEVAAALGRLIEENAA